MTIIVTNQRPAVLDPVHTVPIAQDPYDPLAALQQQVVEPLFEPLSPGTQASIVDDKGNQVDRDHVMAALTACLGESINTQAEQHMKELLGQTMVSFDAATVMPVNELFAVQAGAANKMHPPGPRVIYNASDVTSEAKKLLSAGGDGAEFFASVAYAFHPDTLGIWFQSSAAFNDFKSWAGGQVANIHQLLSGDVNKLLNDFQGLELKGLTEALVLRKDDADGNDPFSFPRVLVHLLMSYIGIERQQAASAGRSVTAEAMPFTLGELLCPRTVVLVNVEAHARALPAKVNEEWDLINRSLSSPVKIVSNKSLAKLTALPRAIQRAKQMGSAQQPGQPGSRSAQVKFRKQPPTGFDITKDLMRVLTRMGRVNRSQNVLRVQKSSFLKANRRNPDDFNKPGKITSTQYMPDLHAFVDTSGSISEDNYQETMMLLIGVAKKLNVNLYFNSFSHFMSQETLLRTENKSLMQIWNQFRRVPKVSGGTEFSQVWRYINETKTRRRRLSLMITDFEWTPPPTRQDHPPNLYYAPCSAMDWQFMVDNARDYADRMQHIDPTVRQKLLGMVA